MSSRIPEIKQVQSLMDRVDTHRHQPAPPPSLTPAELTSQTLDIYREQGVEVDPHVVAYLATQPTDAPLPTHTPVLSDSANDLHAARWLVAGFLTPVAYFILIKTLTLSEAAGFFAGAAMIIFTFAFLFIGMMNMDSAAVTASRSRKVLNAQLQRATLGQLEDLLVNPDCSEEVEKLAQAELLRRQRLLSIKFDTPPGEL